MDPLVIKGFTGTKPNELTGFRYFTVLSTGELKLLPKNYVFFPDYQVAGYYPPIAPLTAWQNLILNPHFRTPSTTVTLRTNLASKVNGTTSGAVAGGTIGINNTRWFGGTPGTGTYTYVTDALDGPIPGVTSYVHKQWSVAAPGNGDTGYDLNAPSASNKYAVGPGVPLVLSIYMRASIDRSGVGISYSYYDSTGAVISTVSATKVTLLAGQWQRLSYSATTPTGTASVSAIADVDTPTASGLWQPGDWLDATALLVEQTSVLGDYFDGSTPATDDFTYSWTGTANASTSLQQAVGVANVNTSTGQGVWYQTKQGIGCFFITNPVFGANFIASIPINQPYTILTRVKTTWTGSVRIRVRQTQADETFFPVVAGQWTNIRYDVMGGGGNAGLFGFVCRSDGDAWGDTLAVEYFATVPLVDLDHPYTGDYFDGSTPVTEDYVAYAWTGTPDNSISTKIEGDGRG